MTTSQLGSLCSRCIEIARERGIRGILSGAGRMWVRLCMKISGPPPLRWIALRLAELFTPPFYGRIQLAELSPRGYVSPRAVIHHSKLRLGANVFIDDGNVIYEDAEGGPVELGDGVHLHRGTIIQTGRGGSVVVGARTHIQPRCQISAYVSRVRIGSGVEIAPFCAFYPYNHGTLPDIPIPDQPLDSKGEIVVEDGAWLGVRVTVLDGVRIGKGAVVAAGAVVTKDVPDGAVAAGVPARVIGMRSGPAPDAAKSSAKFKG